jgi:hypothetical protein
MLGDTACGRRPWPALRQLLNKMLSLAGHSGWQPNPLAGKRFLYLTGA